MGRDEGEYIEIGEFCAFGLFEVCKCYRMIECRFRYGFWKLYCKDIRCYVRELLSRG